VFSVRSNRAFLKVIVVIIAMTLLAAAVSAQKADPKDPKNEELGKQLLKQAIDARGGDKYLNFTTLQATGQFTPYDQGASTVPAPFYYWHVPYEKERVEFGKGKKKNRQIQVNVGNTGWVYDGDAETLKDQTDKQIRDHQENGEFDIDKLMRASWREPGVEVRFAGREELRPGERADVVAIEVKPEQTAFLWLDRNTHLPISLIYEKTGDAGLVRNEYRFFQWVPYDGVKFPNIVDYYRDGIQQNRVNYQSVKLNEPISEDLFAKPANVKAIK